MTGFDEREKGFEKKFELDQELAFKVKARRNKLLAALLPISVLSTAETRNIDSFATLRRTGRFKNLSAPEGTLRHCSTSPTFRNTIGTTATWRLGATKSADS